MIKWLATSAAVTFFICVLFLSLVIQGTSSVISETRKTTLINRISGAQIDVLGAFHGFYVLRGHTYFDEAGTASALSIIESLNAADKIDLEGALDYIASTQNTLSGGFGAWIDHFDDTFRGFDLYTTYRVVHALKENGVLSKINLTALTGFVLSRYNASIGAFSELITEANGRQYAVSWFALGFRSWLDQVAYAIPNVITTFAGISVLADLDSLDLINVTRTLEFIMSTRAQNGLFKPYPTAHQENLPGWSSLLTNPFDVDSYGTGIPYTYAAVSTLKALGRLDTINQSDREKITRYILDCQAESGNFYIHKDYEDDESSYTFYAMMTLIDLNTQSQSDQAIAKVQKHILQAQNFETENQWPIPQPQHQISVSDGNLYGLFRDGGGDPMSDSFRAVAILEATNALSLLDQPTPRSFTVLLNSIIISSLATVLVVLVAIAAITVKNRILARQKQPPIGTPTPSQTIQIWR